MRKQKPKKPSWKIRESKWRRCRACGALVRLPAEPRGRVCPKCGEPLSTSRRT